jgi:hypothetical protein
LNHPAHRLDRWHFTGTEDSDAPGCCRIAIHTSCGLCSPRRFHHMLPSVV